MKALVVVAAALMLLCACSPGARRKHLTVAFVETDAAGAPARKLTLELTQQAARPTCLGGDDWKRAIVRTGESGYADDPAYSMGDGELVVLLDGGRTCDDYDAYSGTLTGCHF